MSTEIKNAVIESTMLGWEDHGILTCYINLDYGGSGQAFGGYALDQPVFGKEESRTSRQFKGRYGTAYGMQFVAEVMKALGVDSWEKLKGLHCRVEAEHIKVHRIGHFLKDQWFSPEEFKERAA